MTNAMDAKIRAAVSARGHTSATEVNVATVATIRSTTAATPLLRVHSRRSRASGRSSFIQDRVSQAAPSCIGTSVTGVAGTRQSLSAASGSDMIVQLIGLDVLHV